jgi:hypothetical protein
LGRRVLLPQAHADHQQDCLPRFKSFHAATLLAANQLKIFPQTNNPPFGGLFVVAGCVG